MTPNYATAIQALAPGAQWSMTNVANYSTLSWYSPDIAQPTEQQLQDEVALQIQQQPLAACKAKAQQLLDESDWSTKSDVTDT